MNINGKKNIRVPYEIYKLYIYPIKRVTQLFIEFATNILFLDLERR